jgi:aminoglycoside 2'-N-acetyltransferase I
LPVRLQTAHTAELDRSTLAAARELLTAAFEPDFSAEDWQHGLGGIHALAWEDAELIGHASVVQRQLLHRGRALRTGYVENVAVRADRRRRGHAGAMMAELERLIRGGYELGALGAAGEAAGFYQGRGWELWQGVTAVLSPDGIQPTPEEDDSIHLLPLSADLDRSAALVCDWREGDVW